MSILIKGMKMPRNCAECFVAWERCHRTVEWYKNNPQYYDIRHEDCPLVEVPTPHGRLVDGDNVIDLLREQLTGDRDTVYEYYDDGLEMAISELSIVTTIIEAEEGEA